MYQQIKSLQNIVSRKGSSKVLTFSVPHVLKALQLLSQNQFVSRAMFCDRLHMGEGAVKTLISHLKEEKLVDSTRSGTFLTGKGKRFVSIINQTIPRECQIKRCLLAPNKYNHAVLIKNYSKAIKTGLQQRDYAILYGAKAATTIIFTNNKFVFPREEKNCLMDDLNTESHLKAQLEPEKNDVIIIASSDDPFISEISAKNSALWTIAVHERH